MLGFGDDDSEQTAILGDKRKRGVGEDDEEREKRRRKDKSRSKTPLDEMTPRNVPREPNGNFEATPTQIRDNSADNSMTKLQREIERKGMERVSSTTSDNMWDDVSNWNELELNDVLG